MRAYPIAKTSIGKKSILDLNLEASEGHKSWLRSNDVNEDA